MLNEGATRQMLEEFRQTPDMVILDAEQTC
ncbi:hypothetical protein U879_18690 [Defluviimonas sp. 20V17]|uniref:Uncharacterized protein n=1 Tax=Allgaiera indica TaxID=765699 RepID=A0A1H2ZR86_9RHOB|nr:hypothetical protein U879_18690 [Defluviimonas sp. 20V17]SDX20082.1 hypothetical protein SAMN05444006_111135 [Allgaiera indica]